MANQLQSKRAKAPTRFNWLRGPRLLAAAGLALAALGASAQARPVEPQAAGLIVKFREGRASEAARDATMQGLRAHAQGRGYGIRGERSTATGARVLQFERGLPAAALQGIARELQLYDASIEYVQPNYIVHPTLVPNDTHYAEQWNLGQDASGGIAADAAWNLSQGTGVRVAVIDTGILQHPDLVANLLPGRDFITDLYRAGDRSERDADPTDPGDWVNAGDCGTGSKAELSSWHGTFVSGVVAARGNNGLGVSGVAPQAQVVPVRVLGRCGGSIADVMDGALWAAGMAVPGSPANANPARVLNLSLSGEYPCTPHEQEAIDRLAKHGVVVVVAAGNESRDVSQASPASCKGVIAVGATNQWGRRSAYSNFGAGVHVSAPGGDENSGVLSTSNAGWTYASTNNYKTAIGTSAATPHVAGTAALMMRMNPQLPVSLIKTLIEETVSPFVDACTICGKGILNAEQAVQAARGWRRESEPNDTLSTGAVLVHPISEVDGSIQSTASTDDEDLILISLPPRSALAVDLVNLTTDFDFDLVQLKQSGQVFLTAKAGGLGKNEHLDRYNTSFTATEYWYFKVKRGAASARTTAAKGYRLKLRRGPVPY